MTCLKHPNKSPCCVENNDTSNGYWLLSTNSPGLSIKAVPSMKPKNQQPRIATLLSSSTSACFIGFLLSSVLILLRVVAA